MCHIKLIPVPFLELVKAKRSVPNLCFSHSYLRSPVSGRLGYLLLPTLLVVCLWSIIRRKVITGTPCIPWFYLIYPWSLDEPQDLTGPPYARWLCLVFPFYFKILNILPGSPWQILYFLGCPCSVMWCTVFFLNSGSSLLGGIVVYL